MSLRKNRQEKLRRILHASCKCSTLEERDAVIDALRPLVEQGWQIDLTYFFIHEPVPRRVTLGARVDVFEISPQSKPGESHDRGDFGPHEMTSDERARYNEIIEMRWFAFATPGDPLPRHVNDLISEAVELRDGCDNFPLDSAPGTTELRVLDAIIDQVIDRTNALRRSFMRVTGPRYWQ